MNFLLHLLGRSRRAPMLGLRPSVRQRLLCAAATAAGDGRLKDALRYLTQRSGEGETRVEELLMRAQLHLAIQEDATAARLFRAGMKRLSGAPHVYPSAKERAEMITTEKEDVAGAQAGIEDAEARGTSLEQLIEMADSNLRRGRYVLAIEQFQQARTKLDTLLAAQGGLILAQARLHGVETVSAKPLVGLAKLGDLLLRMLARTHLASNLAVGLRQRELREDLAPWATTSTSVQELLQGELETLEAAAAEHPNHAEVHYRLGMMARAVGKLELAERALTRVVQLHPHHVLSATRLAATLLELGKEEAVMPLLAITYAVPSGTLQQYRALAHAAEERGNFERAVERLCADLCADVGGDAVAAKANLAFALGELGMLDEERAAWREHAVTPN